ncbi:transposase [Colletotrichum nymphaeae SA-01]|uniref:Transposase n=1 Tax=Colletotrichum nymphaeae SA-01 TaxID=1460502 RepID=A0A135UKG0_9PEZI|nr:transposase [Colletotrichum nymphaeae SA-01]
MAAAKERFQRLCICREEYVRDWIVHVEITLGQRPSNAQIKEFACRLGPVEDSSAYGKNWTRGYYSRNPTAKRIRSSPGRISSKLLHDNELSFHWSKALLLQRGIFNLALNDTRLTSHSKFDYQGAPQTNHIIKCSLMHFNDGDIEIAGRMLRKAFVNLEHELSEGSLTVVQDVCLNIFGITLSYNREQIGYMMLRHCSHLFGLKHVNRLYCIFFECLTHVFCQGKEHSEYYLSQLSMLYANELDNVRSCNDRSSIHANRRYRLITRNSKNNATAEDFLEMKSRSERLLARAASELGNIDDKTLRILNEALRMQNYVHEYDTNYIYRINQARSELEEHYASEQGNTSFESWEQPHQSAYLRLLEREVDYHKDHQDLVEAEKVAKLIFQLEKHQTERWIIFSLQFESWLRHMKQEGLCERIKEERLRLHRNIVCTSSRWEVPAISELSDIWYHDLRREYSPPESAWGQDEVLLDLF